MPQVQGVAYINENKGGNFFFYPKGPGAPDVSVTTQTNSGIVLNGVKVIHGVERFRPDHQAPRMGKGKHSLTYHKSEDVWKVTDSQGGLIQTYNTSDFRISLAWRSLCFQSKEEMDSWDPKSAKINATEFLKRLEDDLVTRGKITKGQFLLDSVEFAIKLVDEYVKYPVDNWKSAWMPNNYCVLPEVISNLHLKSFVKRLLSTVC